MSYKKRKRIEDNDKIRYCRSCKNNGYAVILKKRLYYKEDKSGKMILTEPDHDSELFRQCWRCGNVYKITETKVESSLSPIIEVEDNSREPSVQVLYSRKGRKGRLQKIRDSKSEIKDNEVKKLIRQGNKITNYQEWQLEL